ncbi:uncharacterized protein LOC142350022 isoform X2 [Convolutriloba macropyga]|uniref:uncharacterized protein LOC142350022 isoform X2 n=1 Tax=Convolutriloba macropyga TaxID=536237 RepID=UPI003F523427
MPSLLNQSHHLGVSISFLKEFKRHHLIQTGGKEVSWNKSECLEKVIIPRANEGKCSLANLEERYLDSKGNEHSGDANTLWLYSSGTSVAALIDEVIVYSGKVSHTGGTLFHYIDVLCDNYFSTENERISVYTEVIGRVNNMIVLVDNPLNPFFAQTIFTNWVLYLALKSGTKVTFVSSKKSITELFENLAEKYENVFNLFQQIYVPKKFSKKAQYEEICHSQLKGQNANKAENLIKRSFEKWIVRTCKNTIQVYQGKGNIGSKHLCAALNLGSYLLTLKNTDDADFFLSFCYQNYNQSEFFSKKFGSAAKIKFGQLLVSKLEPETAYQIGMAESDWLLDMSSHVAADLFTLLVASSAQLEDFAQAVHWAKKLFDNKQNELAETISRVNDAEISFHVPGQKRAKRPEEFSTLQREFKMSLNDSDRYLLCQLERAEIATLLGQLQMKAELFQEAADSFTLATTFYTEIYGKIDPLVAKSRTNLDEAKFKLKSSSSK